MTKLTDRAEVGIESLSAKLERESVIFSLVCFLGALASGGFPLLGILLLSYATAALVASGRTALAWVSAGAGAALCFFSGASMGVAATLIALATVAFSVLVYKGFGQMRFFIAVASYAFSLLAVDLMVVYLAGTTIEGQISTMVNQVIASATGDGTVPAEMVTLIKGAVSTIASLWPSFYVLEGIVCTVTVMLVARFAYRRHSASFVAPSFGEFDMSIHVVWLLIGGLLCVAMSYVNSSAAKLIGVVGYNLLICAAIFLAVQGMAIVSYLMRRSTLHWVVQALIYLFAIQLELMFLVPTMVGLIDMWANFRKLPRGTMVVSDDAGRGGDDHTSSQNGANGPSTDKETRDASKPGNE